MLGHRCRRSDTELGKIGEGEDLCLQIWFNKLEPEGSQTPQCLQAMGRGASVKIALYIREPGPAKGFRG